MNKAEIDAKKAEIEDVFDPFHSTIQESDEALEHLHAVIETCLDKSDLKVCASGIKGFQEDIEVIKDVFHQSFNGKFDDVCHPFLNNAQVAFVRQYAQGEYDWLEDVVMGSEPEFEFYERLQSCGNDFVSFAIYALSSFDKREMECITFAQKHGERNEDDRLIQKWEVFEMTLSAMTTWAKNLSQELEQKAKSEKIHSISI